MDFRSNKEIENQLVKVDKINRSDLIYYRQKDCIRVPLVLNYSRGLPNIDLILKNRHKIIENSNRLKLAFQNTLIMAIRRQKRHTNS